MWFSLSEVAMSNGLCVAAFHVAFVYIKMRTRPRLNIAIIILKASPYHLVQFRVTFHVMVT